MNGDNFYSLGFPEKVDFPPSALISKIISGRKPFRLILQREGTSPVQIVIASEYEMDALLRYAVANKDYNCTVTKMDVLRSSGYVTGLSLKNVAIASFLRVSETIASTLLGKYIETMKRDGKVKAILETKHNVKNSSVK